MKRATVKVRTNPACYGRELVERIPYVEVPGYACEVAGEPCVIHRPLSEREGELVEGDGGRYGFWSITHAPSGAKLLAGMANENREALIERAEHFVAERGGREAMLEATARLIEKEGSLSS